MEKRIFIAVVISIAFLALWSALVPRFFPELLKKPAAPVTQTSQTTTTGTPAVTTSTGQKPAATQTTKPATIVSAHVAPVSENTLRETVVDTPEFVATFSNR